MEEAAIALASFNAALERIGLGQGQCNAIIETSGCRNIMMIGLLTADQVSKICKRINTRPVNPIEINMIQEQLLLAITNDRDFTKFYPMQQKGQAVDTLIKFMQDIGIPAGLHIDNAKELSQGRMEDLAQEFWIPITQSKPHSPWQVRAELCIREIKKAVRHTMLRTRAPKRL
jgi:hypothetical protein